jgi:CubicO group peptidase (beta-lactamase class C family)
MITDPAQSYQYMWWVENAQKDGDYHFFAAGKYGQYIDVIPEKSMIIVRHGYKSGYDSWTNLFKNIARIV